MLLPLRYNLRSILQRRVRSALTAAGVAIAVFVAVMMMALTRGLLDCTRESADPGNVILLSKGAESMEFSAIDPSTLHLLGGAHRTASPEAYLSTFVRLPSGEKRGVVRGVRGEAFQAHPRVRLLEGAPPGRGFRVAVGRLASTKLGVPAVILSVGREIEFEGQKWTIAGRFECPGTVLESEIWGDLDDVLAASKRSDFSAIVVRAGGPDDAEDLVLDLSTRTDIRVDARIESDYYAAMADALAPVRAVSIAMTVLLTLGGILAGMNTMFTSILGRTREMGVLLVLGYRRSSILLSFVIESVVLCLAGGALAVAGGAALNGFAMRVPMGAFRFVVDLGTAGFGIDLSVGIGLAGGLFPVLRVARIRIVEALRTE